MRQRNQKISKMIARTRLIVERFEILRTLGSGGAGVVYQVRDRMLGNRELALKVLANTSAFDSQTMKRFIREMEILKVLRHPNLIEAYDFIEVANLVAFTMEYIEGQDLGKLLHSKKLTHSLIDHIFASILSALAELHEHGIAHRDIKLENVLVANDGTAKLSDLGIVKQLEKPGSTMKGVLLGTTQYLPPEYVQYSHYDARGDIYAVGLMLYECLSGNRWLQHKPGQQAVEVLSDCKFEFPKLALSGLPRKYVNVLERALAVDPSQRYNKAQQMREAIMSSTGCAERSVTIEVKQQLHLSDYCDLPLRVQQAKTDFKQRTVLFSVLIMVSLCATIGAAVLFSVPRGTAGRLPQGAEYAQHWEEAIRNAGYPFNFDFARALRLGSSACSADNLTSQANIWTCSGKGFQFALLPSKARLTNTIPAFLDENTLKFADFPRKAAR